MTTKSLEFKTTRKPKQVRSADTRKKILKMTAKEIAATGLSGLRYAHIAKAAKVPQALMGYHFPNLESLLFEVVGQELEKIKTISTDRLQKHASNPRKALEQYIRAPFELAANDEEFRAVWSGFYHLATITPIFTELNASIRIMGRDRIVNLVTMVLATEGYLVGQRLVSRDILLDMATKVQGIMTGMTYMASSESNSDYKKFADLAVNASFGVLGITYA